MIARINFGGNFGEAIERPAFILMGGTGDENGVIGWIDFVGCEKFSN